MYDECTKFVNAKPMEFRFNEPMEIDPLDMVLHDPIDDFTQSPPTVPRPRLALTAVGGGDNELTEPEIVDVLRDMKFPVTAPNIAVWRGMPPYQQP